MERVISGIKGRNFDAIAAGGTIDGYRITDCHFGKNEIGLQVWRADPDRIVKRCRIENCSGFLELGPCLIEDAEVVNSNRATRISSRGARFRHVKLEGKFRNVVCLFRVMRGDPEGAFDADVVSLREHYASTDWALDISEARFVDTNFPAVPGSKILRDPETQFIVTREAACARAWEPMLPAQSGLRMELQMIAELPLWDDSILVAPMLEPKRAERYLEQAKRLKDAGILR